MMNLNRFLFILFLFVDVPRVQLELGRNLQSDHIREGIDVYFNCHVTARPSGVRLVWRHQVRPSVRDTHRARISLSLFSFSLVFRIHKSSHGHVKWTSKRLHGRARDVASTTNERTAANPHFLILCVQYIYIFFRIWTLPPQNWLVS